MKSVEVIRVVRTRLSCAGEGTAGNPIRSVVEYWTLDGERLAEVDPMTITIRPGDPLWEQLAKERGFPT